MDKTNTLWIATTNGMLQIDNFLTPKMKEYYIEKLPDYISIVLCSKGLGANYAKENQLKHRWNREKTITTYKAHNVS